MKLEKLSINNFGKFEQKELIFHQGLNIICGENEAGKTTIQMFIKAMLYTLGKRDEKRYLPWNADKFGAANTLTYVLDNGQPYAIEKNFNRKTTSVYTMQPYEEVTALFPRDKGNVLLMEEQTGLDLASFENSVFVRQLGIEVNKKDSKGLVERLVRLTRYGDENIDYNDAIKKLDELKDIIGSGNSGKHKKLIQVNQLVNDLQEKLSKARENARYVRELQQRMEQLNSQKQGLAREVEELTLRQQDKRRSVIQYRGQQKEKLEQYIAEKEKVQLQKGANDLGQTDIRMQLIEDKVTQLKNQRSAGRLSAIISALICGAVAFTFGNIHPGWYSLLLLIPIALLLLSSYSKGIESRIRQLIAKQHQLETKMDAGEKPQVLEKLIEALQQELEEDIDEQMNSTQIDQRVDEKKLELKKTEIMLSSIEKELELISKEYIHPGDVEEQLETALQEKKEYENTREAIDAAKYYLQQSLKEVQQNYIPALNRYTGDILREITEEKYHAVDTGSDLSVFIRDRDNGLLDLNTLSGGTVDQVYFSLRLAIAQMLSVKETLPLILDEPFAHYDDHRLKSALDFLIKVAESRQVILFTCHKRESELLALSGKEYYTILL
ncbi:MAG: ATP-binding protein [Clostridia bacterium]